MSLSKTAPAPSPHSSSPSKSSLRRTSGSRNPSARSLLPSPHLDEPVISGSYSSPRDVAEIVDTASARSGVGSSTHRSHDPQQQQQVQTATAEPFQPFFTLIEDAVTHEHFHPAVHYIFADDDADIVTEAALRSLEQHQEPGPEGSEPAASRGPPVSNEHGPDSRYLPPAKEGVKEHYVVLDVQPSTTAHAGVAASVEGTASGNVGGASSSGYDVVNAYSMSADWQVLRTGISKAPTMAEGEDEGLMLRIEGRSGTPPEVKQEDETVEEMIERFERGLEDVRLVLEASRRTEMEAPEELRAGSR
ncbi:uncharacterized protein HMPREF1541_06232 [Cyphellophora europaea CBS 101466]|uniref:Anaphase-promoting complex subunit 11 RING-H2 finger domain-containing protein n=1 Tax=Cyphellophora europaea (strain CBS 101466) TaxID=1220924 RepID=W2RNT9_CYPE1|nr:uncharacterized protein HMPREF1541_06232 [Cyphellophora europaea CBS 101466]ETN38201.1 hypothetical protein HMPREF1541_06232 [Cyphellophora europaea CBS 101466]